VIVKKENCLEIEYYCYPDVTESDKRNKYLQIAGTTMNVSYGITKSSDKIFLQDLDRHGEKNP
jgi:hypothetical protein